MQRNRNIWPICRKKNRNCPEEAQTSDLLDKDFKSGILRMFKELEETMYNELRKL